VLLTGKSSLEYTLRTNYPAPNEDSDEDSDDDGEAPDGFEDEEPEERWARKVRARPVRNERRVTEEELQMSFTKKELMESWKRMPLAEVATGDA